MLLYTTVHDYKCTIQEIILLYTAVYETAYNTRDNQMLLNTETNEQFKTLDQSLSPNSTAGIPLDLVQMKIYLSRTLGPSRPLFVSAC